MVKGKSITEYLKKGWEQSKGQRMTRFVLEDEIKREKLLGREREKEM